MLGNLAYSIENTGEMKSRLTILLQQTSRPVPRVLRRQRRHTMIILRGIKALLRSTL